MEDLVFPHVDELVSHVFWYGWKNSFQGCRLQRSSSSPAPQHLDLQLEEIKTRVKEHGHATHDFIVQWIDIEGVVNSEIQRHCYIADKEFYKKKKGDSQSTKLEFKIGKK